MRRAFWRGEGARSARRAAVALVSAEAIAAALVERNRVYRAVASRRAGGRARSRRRARLRAARPERLGERLLLGRRALDDAQLAQLPLRLVRPGRARVGRQAAARPLGRGRAARSSSGSRASRSSRRRRSPASARSGSSISSSRGTSAASPACWPRSRSPSRRCRSRSTATTTRTRCFVLLLVAAAWAGARAVESGRLRWLLGCAVFVGLAFNAKMLAAAVVVPGLALAYLLFARTSLKTRLWHLAVVAGLALAVLVLSVDRGRRPDARRRPAVRRQHDRQQRAQPGPRLQRPRSRHRPGGRHVVRRRPRRRVLRNAGLFRLLNDALGDQGAWLLPLAIVGFALRRGLGDPARDRAQLGPLVILGGWFFAAACRLQLLGRDHPHLLPVGPRAGDERARRHRDRLAGARRATRRAVGGAAAARRSSSPPGSRSRLLDRSSYDSWLMPLVVAAAVASRRLR